MAETKLSKKQEQDHVRIQRDAAKRTLAAQGRTEARHQDAHINSEATVASHAGLAPEDKAKSREMEALKTDLKDVTGAPDVHRVDLETPGKGATDKVTAAPEGAQPAGGSPAPESHVSKAARAAKAGAKKSGGKKARGKTSREQAAQ